MSRVEDIRSKFAAVRASIDSARLRAGRQDAVRVLGVTKGQDGETLQAWIQAAGETGGTPLVGENYLQEWREKCSAIDRKSCEVHFIGRLQRNKVAAAVEHFDVIESVDSPRLAAALQTEASRVGKKQAIMLQVNISGDEAKQGFTVDAVQRALIDFEEQHRSLSIIGLMAITRFYDEPERARADFRRLRELREYLARPELELSMGMSADFEVAVEEGATVVRLGTTLFGERHPR